MVDRPKDDEGREHARRPYVSDKPHFDQMRMQTDAFVARYGKRPHSEDKKPYFEDIDYPEMEHFFFGWKPPVFPPFDPVFPPDVPGNPNVPAYPYRPPPDKPVEPTLGCLFWPPRFEPFVITPGESAWAYFHVYEGDALTKLTTHGPIDLLTSVGELNNCRRVSGPAKCLVSIRAKGSLEGYGPNPGQSLLQAAVVAELASGGSCSAEVLISPCDSTSAPEWDFDRNPETASGPGDVAIYLVEGKGVPPFDWTLSGTGCSLAFSRTKVRSNLLRMQSGFCGSAVINVTDACGRRTWGAIRSTNGSWQITDYVCDIPGPHTEASQPYFIRQLHHVKIQIRTLLIIMWNSCSPPLSPDHSDCAGCFDKCLYGPHGCYKGDNCEFCVILPYACPLRKNCTGTDLLTGDCSYCHGGGLSRFYCWCPDSPSRREWKCQ